MITVTTGPGSIEIYTFDGDGDVSPSTEAHSPSLAGNPLPTKVAVLKLPPTKPGQGPTRFQTHSAPFVSRPTPGRAFETSPDSRLHVMELSYGDHGRRCNLFVRNRFLLSHVPADLNSGVVSAPLTKRWEEWGPDNTRFMEMIGRFQWLRCVALFPLEARRGAFADARQVRACRARDFAVDIDAGRDAGADDGHARLQRAPRANG